MAQTSKVAIVTGASRGIGKAIATELAARGYDLAICARSVNEHDQTPYPGTIHETAGLIRAQGRRALPIQADLTRMDDVRKVVDQAMREFGRVDLMVNNSRYVGDAHWKFLADTSWQELEDMLAVNLHAPLLFCKLLLPIMAAQKGGVIVNISSSSAMNENPNLPTQGSTGIGYPVTKAGLNRIASAMAKEVKQHNIAVINLSPGSTLTERGEQETAKWGFDLSRYHSTSVPAKALAHMATCANPMAFSGKYYESKDLVREFGLMSEEELVSPKAGRGG